MRLSFVTIDKKHTQTDRRVIFRAFFYAIILLSFPLIYAEVFVTLTRLPSES